MQSTWREALGTAWGNLTGVTGDASARGARLLFFLIFLAGSGYAAYSYYQMQELRKEKTYTASAAPTTVAADKQRLDKMVGEVRAASSLRSNSAVWADTMRGMGKYVFSDPVRIVTPPPTEPGGGGSIPRPPEIVIEPPPGLVVKAIMLMGNSRVAVMDIDGVGRGVIVRQGDSFLNRKGRIVRITADRVVVRWNGKNWNIAPGF